MKEDEKGLRKAERVAAEVALGSFGRVSRALEGEQLDGTLTALESLADIIVDAIL